MSFIMRVTNFVTGRMSSIRFETAQAMFSEYLRRTEDDFHKTYADEVFDFFVEDGVYLNAITLIRYGRELTGWRMGAKDGRPVVVDRDRSEKDWADFAAKHPRKESNRVGLVIRSDE